jgi:DNA polymerase III delta prime subunit
METKTIYGHGNVQALLARQLEGGDFPHAYLFFGPAGVGKYLAARQFANRILNDSQSDFFELDLAEQNSIEQLREFLSVISSRPVRGVRKVAVINNFDLASPALGNALLKTLEEPSPSTIIMLISSRPPLPTVASRCQVISFNRLSLKELEQFAQDNNLNAPQEILAIASGSPARLMQLANNDPAAQNISSWAERLKEVQNRPVSEKLLFVSELGGEETETLREVLLAFLERQRSALSVHPEAVPAMRKTLEALDLLRFNLNKKLVLQRLLL